MIEYTEARRFVLERCRRAEPTVVPLAEALDLVAAESVEAREQVPPFANTAVDGFAVRAADLHPDRSTALRIVGTVRAGMSGLDSPVGPGEAARIMTGAPVPPGADAIVMVERTEVSADGNTVIIGEAVNAGDNLRPAGDDIEPGDVLLEPGTRLTAAHLGMLATVGVTHLAVVPRPRVGVISTGDELVEGGGPLGPGQIRDSNRLALRALLRSSGFDTVDLGLVRDDEAAIEGALLAGVEHCDALVTSGGVSMGDFDYIKVVLDRIGDMRWMQVAIKPAKPLAFGTITRRSDGAAVPVFGLPGNPVSSMVSFELFCRPGLRQMAGAVGEDLDRPTVLAVAEEPLTRRPDGKIHFARVRCTHDLATGTHRVRSAGAQGSHQMAAMAAADALAVLPDGPTIEAGAAVRVLLLAP
ncbi:MAG: molybdopterin molybdotransferase MoeA [Acidobacteria bacterium]|nr:molybdopterin molybdotransferase MoeA [Acidobacteriota bacterium]